MEIEPEIEEIYKQHNNQLYTMREKKHVLKQYYCNLIRRIFSI